MRQMHAREKAAARVSQASRQVMFDARRSIPPEANLSMMLLLIWDDSG